MTTIVTYCSGPTSFESHALTNLWEKNMSPPLFALVENNGKTYFRMCDENDARKITILKWLEPYQCYPVPGFLYQLDQAIVNNLIHFMGEKQWPYKKE